MAPQIKWSMFPPDAGDDDDETEYLLPAKYEVCPRCQGNGTHVNPSIDGNGITESEWAEWDDESRENYFTGVYDVQCEECHGLRVVSVPDREACVQMGLQHVLEDMEFTQETSRCDDYEERYIRMQENGGNW